MKKNLFKQLIKFGIVGLLAFIIDYGLLYFCTEFLNIYVLYSSIISFSVSVIFNYILSIKWVFDVNHKQTYKDFILFIILSLIGLLINQIIMFLGIYKLHIYYMIVKIISTGIVMIYNFITRKIFIEKNSFNFKDLINKLEIVLIKNKVIVSIIMMSLSYFVICYTKVLKAYDIYSWFIFLCLIILCLKTDIFNKKFMKECIIFSFLFSFIIIYGSIAYKLLYNNQISIFSKLFTFRSLIKFIGTFNLIYVLMQNVLPYLFKFSLKDSSSKIKKSKYIFIISMTFILLCWSIYFLAFFPGILTTDSIAELKIITNNFSSVSDHHPVIHILFIALPYNLGLKLFNNVIMAVATSSIFQMLIMSGIFSSFIVFLHKRKINDYILLFVLLFYGLVPLHCYYSITMWKDIIFGGILLLLTMETVKIIEKDKEDNLRFKNMIGFLIVSILCVFFRNNAIYMYFIFSIFSLIIFRKHIKLFGVIFCIVFGIYFIVKVPIFNILNITKSESTEYIGMPLQQIGRMAYKNVSFTKEEQELINKLIPIDIMAKDYDPIISDAIKFNDNYNTSEFDNNKLEYLKLYIKLVFKHPSIALEAYTMSTLGYWFPNVNYWTVSKKVRENNLGITMDPVVSLNIQKYLKKLESRNLPIANIEWSIGFCFWVILIFCFISVRKNKLKGLYPYIPVFGIWLTMMIASPVFGELRYVYGAYTCLPLLILCPYIIKLKISIF